MPHEDALFEPATGGNFLERYRLARQASAPSSPATAPRAVPTRKSSQGAMQVWGSVFHPLGKSPTGADRYDSTSVSKHGTGDSVSEMHDEARSSALSLDEIRE